MNLFSLFFLSLELLRLMAWNKEIKILHGLFYSLIVACLEIEEVGGQELCLARAAYLLGGIDCFWQLMGAAVSGGEANLGCRGDWPVAAGLGECRAALPSGPCSLPSWAPGSVLGVGLLMPEWWVYVETWPSQTGVQHWCQ